MPKKRIVVIGAGLAGLSAAWHLQRLGEEALVLEKELQPGGICRSKNLKGFSFDYDGHLLHFRNKYTFNLVKRFLIGNLQRHIRNSQVFLRNYFIPYPFQANLYALPFSLRKRCLQDFIRSQGQKKHKVPCNFKDWLFFTFGKSMARVFFIPYNSKFWKLPLENLTTQWLDGFIPVPSVKEVKEGAKEENKVKFGYNAEFWYPKRGGIGVLGEAMAQELKCLQTNCGIERINLKEKSLLTSRREKLSYDYLIYTGPLPELRFMLQGCPREIVNLFRFLRWNSILNLNLGIKGDVPFSHHWIYFPEKEFSFFRVGFYSNFSSTLTPPGTFSLYAELSSPNGLDKNSILKRIKGDLLKVKLISDMKKICVEDTNFLPYAYPVFDKNWSFVTQKLAQYLQAKNIFLCGRFASWQYLSMEGAILQGKEIAQKIWAL